MTRWKLDDHGRRYREGQETFTCPALAHGRDFDGKPLRAADEDWPPLPQKEFTR